MANLKKVWEPLKHPMIISDKGAIYWPDFYHSVVELKCRIEKSDFSDWAVFFDHPGFFSIAFWALVESDKNIHFYSNPPENDKGSIPLLSDTENLSKLAVGFQKSEDGKLSVGMNENNFSSNIILHTSGSTGESKRVIKSLKLINREVEELKQLWEDKFSGTETLTTVSHQHFYGLLFSILLPLTAGSTIFNDRIIFPESLLKFGSKKTNLITSPAFLKRIGEISGNRKDSLSQYQLYSSGGFLPDSAACQAIKLFGSPVTEIYGSTETGGIAWKRSPGDKLWKLFSCTALYQEESGSCRLESEYIEGSYTLDDAVEIMNDGSFKLLGRLDSIVKVEDKRVSLNEIESRILESGFAVDVYACLMESNRQFIAIAVQLNDRGMKLFEEKGKLEVNKSFRNWLGGFFHPTLLPKKWRYPDKIPRDSQGKIKAEEAKALFSNQNKNRATEKLSEKPEILSSYFSEFKYEFVLRFPKNYRYFDGHFHEMKILPALAQVDWVIKVVSEKLEQPIPVKQISRMKFKSPIFPDRNIRLTIDLNPEKSQIQYEYKSEDESRPHSNGRIRIEEGLL